VLISFRLFIASVFAFPPYATLDTFYYANATEIAARFIGCTRGSISGQTTEYANVER